MQLEAKLYLNGFPKSGTHAIESLGKLLLPQLTKRNWLGNVEDNAFSTSSAEVDVVKALDDFIPGRYVRGHMAYSPEIADAFTRNKISKVFIFRDFRDVAVSAAFHAQKEVGGMFPNKEFYQGLEFDEVLRRIIVGDDTISGVMERWEMYSGWLDEEWVLKLTYEDFLEHKEGVASLFLRYLYGKTGAYNGVQITLDYEDYERELSNLVASMQRPEKSITYRKGVIGDWKNYFTDEHKDLFKQTDTGHWLERLGYTDDRDW